MLKTKNFSQEELEFSNTAKKNGINNTIPEELLPNAKELLEGLQQIRDVLNKPIKITSGYRAEKLNKLVGGVKNSSHLKAWAADIKVDGMTAKELFCWLSGYLKGSGMKFGQLIMEHSKTGDWVHFSIRDDGKQGCKIFSLNV